MSRFLFIGAHPDDPDLFFGGTAIQRIRNGHKVQFVSAVNGDAGHYAMTREALAKRRRGEADKAAKIIGLEEYQILSHHDCGLECSLANREEITRIIRQFRPDVVITHAPIDYHPDHRICSQLVLDSAYLLGVPLFCPDTPIPEVNPVIAFAYHSFTDPRPIRVDAAVEFDSVLEEKLRVLDCHESQFYEWLPWGDFGMKNFDVSKLNWEQRKEHLLTWFKRFETAADMGRKALVQSYGERGRKVRYAEVFEQTQYGRQMSPVEFQQLFTA